MWRRVLGEGEGENVNQDTKEQIMAKKALNEYEFQVRMQVDLTVKVKAKDRENAKYFIQQADLVQHIEMIEEFDDGEVDTELLDRNLISVEDAE